MANYQLVKGQSVNLHVSGLNGGGQLVPAFPTPDPVTHVYPVPVWTTADATRTQLIPSPDGNTCEILGIKTGVGILITATAGILFITFLIDIVSDVPVSLVINPNPPIQGPGNIDQRQLSAGGRYLGLGFNSPPNS